MLALVKGGGEHNRFWGSFTTGALAILKGTRKFLSSVKARNVFAILNREGYKKFLPFKKKRFPLVSIGAQSVLDLWFFHFVAPDSP